jgi:hypothetical protein
MPNNTPTAWIPALMHAADHLEQEVKANVAKLRAQHPEVFEAHEAEMKRSMKAYGGEIERTAPDLEAEIHLDAARQVVIVANELTGFDAAHLLSNVRPHGYLWWPTRFAYQLVADFLNLQASPLGGVVQERQRYACAAIVQALLSCKTRGTKYDKLQVEPMGLNRNDDWCGAALRYARRELPGIQIRYDYMQHYRIRPADAAALQTWSQVILDDTEPI